MSEIFQATPGAPGRAPSAVERDVATVLRAAVARLAQATGCPRVAVWQGDAEGEARILAATPEATGPHPANPILLETLVDRARAVDLGETPAREEALRTGFGAGVALGRAGAGAPVLVLGGPRDPAGGARCETLAALDAEAARLGSAVDVQRASGRLAALDESVRRLDSLAGLGELVSEIVHEIRNPLVSVKTFLELLPQRADDPEFRTRFLEVVGEEVRRIERLLGQVLDQAQPAPEGGGQETEPARVLEDVAGLLSHRAQERGVHLEVRADAAAPVPMERDGLHQVVLNLALNAIDATPPGGTVRLVAVAAEGAARVACDDDGPGIPEALRERIFEPFFSTKTDRPGGLGLAIARRMVLASGGTIRAETRSEGGTRMALAWPLAGGAGSR